MKAIVIVYCISTLVLLPTGCKKRETGYSVGNGYDVVKPAEQSDWAPETKEMLARLTVDRDNVFTETITRFKTLRETAKDFRTVQSLDLVIRELSFLQKIAQGKLALIAPDGNVVVFGDIGIRQVDDCFQEYGVIVPQTGWEAGPFLGARRCDRENWLFIQDHTISSGRWQGGYGDSQDVLLPGLKCFEAGRLH